MKCRIISANDDSENRKLIQRLHNMDPTLYRQLKKPDDL